MSRSKRCSSSSSSFWLQSSTSPTITPASAERRTKLALPELRLRGGELECLLADRGEGLRRGSSVRRAHEQAGLLLAHETGDANLEELVQVGREVGAAPRPLEEGQCRIRRAREDARVVVEPGKLPIEQSRLVGHESRLGASHSPSFSHRTRGCGLRTCDGLVSGGDRHGEPVVRGKRRQIDPGRASGGNPRTASASFSQRRRVFQDDRSSDDGSRRLPAAVARLPRPRRTSHAG